MNKELKTFRILLAGNPNVGKSTVFNVLTGMKQHTGNWAGKTVMTACGNYNYSGCKFEITDLPGTYSLLSSSPDEAVAENSIFFEKADCIIVVINAVSPEQSINLALEILSVTANVVLCVNLCDEARKKGIDIISDELSIQLGVPVIKTAARSKKGIDELKEEVYLVSSGIKKTYRIERYINFYDEFDEETKKAINMVENEFEYTKDFPLHGKALAIHMTAYDEKTSPEKFGLKKTEKLLSALSYARKICKSKNLKEMITEKRINICSEICRLCTNSKGKTYSENDRKIDKILTSKFTGIPIMLLLIALIFYITIIGANYPSEWLSKIFKDIGISLSKFLSKIDTPIFLQGILVDGIYLTLTNVISVMLPPMAIFFPLFTLLEDLGYLPRVSFNLDSIYCHAGTNGKQSLTSLMGFGCNACGITGCRIFENKRERTIAILTNNFSPCNGRFPTLIMIISMFLVGTVPFGLNSLLSALILVALILLGILISLLVSKILSLTLYQSGSNSFIMELPPFRPPQILRTIIRSVFDRTVFILMRAAAAAIPAGIIIWLLANTDYNGKALILYFTEFLSPFANIMGLDGTILASFILGFPANEIVFPIAAMIYTSCGKMTDTENLNEFHNILIMNGWTVKTAVCTMLFTLMHFPCATACITVYKETKSIITTIFSFLIPTICGIVCCTAANIIFSFFGL